ncbi:MAG: NTP transferase domain-containing protein [Oscillospiraceae bacterium]|nr:NTP transferase domain-containing protein [Oscillospiraceae bacterium]
MTTAALITAAGMSSRMGDFKPMLNVGSISIAQRVVATFQQAGVDKIVMVTGYNAVMLERHLAGNGIVFLRNEEYETTQMFESVCIGLRYLKDKCDRVLFTPVDIPLFTAETVQKLLESDEPLAGPVCGGKLGHPMLIATTLIDTILADPGEGGLRGALDRCGAEMALISVEDRGVLHDADTPEDYHALLKYHNEQLVRPVIGVSLAREKVFFDSRTAMLLQLVDETHSVRMACQRMQISYSSGWNTIRTLESQLHYSLVQRSQGGAGGGKSFLTEKGRTLLERYEAYAAAVRDTAGELYEDFFAGLFG